MAPTESIGRGDRIAVQMTAGNRTWHGEPVRDIFKYSAWTASVPRCHRTALDATTPSRT
jgi:hypothetical protein